MNGLARAYFFAVEESRDRRYQLVDSPTNVFPLLDSEFHETRELRPSLHPFPAAPAAVGVENKSASRADDARLLAQCEHELFTYIEHASLTRVRLLGGFSVDGECMT